MMSKQRTSALVEFALTAESDGEFDSSVSELKNLLDQEELFSLGAELCLSRSSKRRFLGVVLLDEISDSTLRSQVVNLLKSEILREGEAEMIGMMLKTVSHSDASQAVSLLTHFAKDPSSEVRYFVAIVASYDLSLPFRQEIIPMMIGLASDTSPDVRYEAIAFVADCLQSDAEQTTRMLLNAANDTDSAVRGQALLGLARRAHADVEALVIRELQKDEISVGTVEVARLLGSPAFYPHLVRLQGWWTADKQLLARALNSCEPK